MTTSDRRIFSYDEQQSILNYIINSERYMEVKGRALWQDMEKDQVCHRSWQSMKENFRRKIMLILHKFNVSEDERENLITGAGHKYVQKRKHDVSKLNFNRDFSSSEEESNPKRKKVGDEDDDVVICEKRTSFKYRKHSKSDDENNRNCDNETITNNIDTNLTDEEEELLLKFLNKNLACFKNENIDDSLVLFTQLRKQCWTLEKLKKDLFEVILPNLQSRGVITQSELHKYYNLAGRSEDGSVKVNGLNCKNNNKKTDIINISDEDSQERSERLSIDFLSPDSSETSFEEDEDVAPTIITTAPSSTEPIFNIYTDADNSNIIQVKKNNIRISFSMKELESAAAEGVNYLNLHKYAHLYLLKEMFETVKKEINTFAFEISEKKFDETSSSDSDENKIFLLISNCMEYMCEFNKDVIKNFSTEMRQKICKIENVKENTMQVDEETTDKNKNEVNVVSEIQEETYQIENESIIIPNNEIPSTSTARNYLTPIIVANVPVSLTKTKIAPQTPPIIVQIPKTVEPYATSSKTTTDSVKTCSLNVRSREQINLLVEGLNSPEGKVRVKPLSKLCQKNTQTTQVSQTSKSDNLHVSKEPESVQLRIDQIKREPESPPSLTESEFYIELLEEYMTPKDMSDSQTRSSDEDCTIVEAPEVIIKTSPFVTPIDPGEFSDKHVEHNYHSSG